MQHGEEGAHETERIRAVYARRDRRGPRLRGIDAAYALINEERRSFMLDMMRAHLRQPHPRLLDVGCGSGSDLQHWLGTGWPVEALAGVDLVAARIRDARARCPGVDLRVVDGPRLPFADATFDVATAVTVLSSILDPAVRRDVFLEMWRVVRPGGLVLVYDFVVRKPWNGDVVPMGLSRLRELGPAPIASRRLSPLLHLVALVAGLNTGAARSVARLAPRTHRLTAWRVSGPG